MANMVGLSRLAYGDIERGKSKIDDARLKQIAEKLGVSVHDIDDFAEKVNNFFDQCSGVIGLNNGQQINHYDSWELRHQIEKAHLEIEKLKLEADKYRAERDRAELEARYWREKGETVD